VGAFDAMTIIAAAAAAAATTTTTASVENINRKPTANLTAGRGVGDVDVANAGAILRTLARAAGDVAGVS